MKRLLILVAVLAGLALPGTAGASAPCRNRVFNDWYKDGRIASSYPVGCYRDALKHIPADAKIYSSLSTDIRSAMQAAIRRGHGKVVPKQVGRGFKPVKAAVKGANEVVSLGHVAVGSVAPLGNVAPHDPASGGGIADTASNAPLPILVLGGLALALAGAGGIGAGVRYTRRRRSSSSGTRRLRRARSAGR